MRSILAILSTVLVLIAVAQAIDPDVNTMPACAVTCAKSALANSITCSSTNVTCLCTDKSYNAALLECVLASCTVKEALVAQRLNARQCGVPIKPRSRIMIITRSVFLSLTTLFIGIRIYVKSSKFGGSWWWDDFCILLAYAVAIGYYVDNTFVTKYGLGVDMYDLSFYEITMWFRTFYIIEPLYKFEMSLAKISVCLFFLRIFPSRSFHAYTIIVITINAVVGLLFSLIDTFQCIPVDGAWNRWAGEEEYRCLNFPVVVLCNGIINVVLDVVMLSLPIYEVTRLNLSRRRKVSVAVMFSMGFILTIVGIYRNEEFSHHLHTTNPTVDLAPLHYWSLIECDLSIICASLPDTRLFLRRLFPNLFKSTTSATSPMSGSKNAKLGVGGTAGARNNISMTTTYEVHFSTKPNSMDTESCVQLVDLERISELKGGG